MISLAHKQLENQLANAVCEDYCSKGAVVPAQLHSGLFTVGALDSVSALDSVGALDLDHNPTNSTAKGSLLRSVTEFLNGYGIRCTLICPCKVCSAEMA